jgi:hypothetical protein
LANFCARQRTSALRHEPAKPRDHDLFPSKLSEAALGYAVQEARKSFPNHSIVVLTDNLSTSEPCIECPTSPTSVMDRYSPDETIFVHVFDANGQLVAQADGAPLRELFPLSACQPGEQIRDIRSLALPTDAFTLKVGVYNRTTQQRLEAIDTIGNPLIDDAVLVDARPQ